MKLVQNSFAQLEISYPNLQHNYNYFRSLLDKKTRLLILIKANSYGHGAVEFARIMEEMGADYFAVAHPIEGVELRMSGIKKPILVLTAGTDYFEEIVNHYLEPSIPSISALKAFNAYLKEREIERYPVHLTLDTGMHRLGFMKPELPELVDFLKGETNVKIKSIFSHLAAADEPQHDSFTLDQIAKYQEYESLIESALDYKPIRHILNSAGIERFPQYQFDMVRLGVGIYGVSSVNGEHLKPAASLKCNILQIKHLKPEDGTVGYGRKGQLEHPKTIATLPLGYADGIDRKFGNGRARFFLNGHLVPTIGNICMDMFMIDITGVPAEVGDTVTIYGDRPTVMDLAELLDTIPYEIFTSVARRIKRVVIE